MAICACVPSRCCTEASACMGDTFVALALLYWRNAVHLETYVRKHRVDVRDGQQPRHHQNLHQRRHQKVIVPFLLHILYKLSGKMLSALYKKKKQGKSLKRCKGIFARFPYNKRNKNQEWRSENDEGLNPRPLARVDACAAHVTCSIHSEMR